ncbi:uncharacterized protein LOC129588943 [Paramacrobiotus metropolitanus]|uniref:uncharacterized protein LOC129588943 n=1 Tax=Paramacrobiotus metropolitanus TaxID=2943436 RepID=UPI002445620B|nr:uncharacterized protein LOC129588943 [Paramacrobiotus metropolitanus]
MLEMAQLASGQLEKRLVKGAKVIEAADNLPNNQYVIRIVDGYVPCVSNRNAQFQAGLIKKCLDPVAVNRISAEQLLHELQEKQFIVFYPSAWKFDHRFLILFDPTVGCFTVEKVVNAPAALRRGGLSAHHRQIKPIEIIFTERSHVDTNGFSKFRFWNVGRNTWRELALPLNVGLAEDFIVVNHKIYILGYNQRFMEIDTYTGMATALDDSPVEAGMELLLSQVAKSDDQIYFATRYRLYRYNIIIGKWEALQNLPQWRAAFAMAVVNGYLYIIGGYVLSAYDSASSDCIRLNLNTGTWEEIEPLGQPRCRHAVHVINDRIYVCGGNHSEAEPAQTIEMYNTKHGGGWSTINFLQKNVNLLSDLASTVIRPWQFITATSTCLNASESIN